MSTVEKLEAVKRHGTEAFSQMVASEILLRYRPEDINRTGKIGFWWHETHPHHFPLGQHGGGETDSASIHAYCNPLSQPNGPWPVVIHFGPMGIRKKNVKDDFGKAGFLLLEDAGKDTEPGDKALAFGDSNK